MANDLYWISALTYAGVLFFILCVDLTFRKNPDAPERAYRRLSTWIILFCLQDCFWGLCECKIIRGDGIFFVSSSIFHASTMLSTIFWLHFVMTYLEVSKRFKRVAYFVNTLLLIMELVLVLLNIRTPILFSIKNGAYVTEKYRSFTFCNQYLVFLVVSILVYIYSIMYKDDETKKTERYKYVFIGTMGQVLLGICQLFFPDAPFYSLGYSLGCTFIYILVVTKDREEGEKSEVYTAVANTMYSIHIINIEEDTITRAIEPAILTGLIGNEKSARQMVYKAVSGTCRDEYRTVMLEFINFGTLSERLKGRKYITCEFVGKFHGWTRMTFVVLEREHDTVKKVALTTQIIDSEKRKQMELIFSSNNDELTGLYNRRAFETEITELEVTEKIPNPVVVMLDVNGLKTVNDELGHEAGDEIIIGAAQCMQRTLGVVGKIFRTGGDEFAAILSCDEERMRTVFEKFDYEVVNWRGRLVDKLTISYGFVSKAENPKAGIREMFSVADKRMYEMKSAHYRKQGVDRRGQKDAHTALCALYTKILKINLTDDSYQIIDMVMSERTEEKGFSDHISTWLSGFGTMGQVHSEDLNDYLRQTDMAYMRDYFRRNKNSLIIFYRRLFGDEYKRVMMEIIPAGDYTDENQSLFLYVKSIDK